MIRSLLALIVLAGALTAPASAQGLDDAKALARLYAGAKFFLESAEPDKARRYAQSMYLLLMEKEAENGSDYADRLFYQATGMTGSRRAFFRSMDVVERDGSPSSIPQEQEKKRYTCRRQHDDSVACLEK
ncbi:hypothetical protein [Methylobacterium fujisawaense]|uniref:hypothetical protein n=1 Tax=Methylobacterium fujisawaense TaxID=107400 RepID=UPI00313CE3B1